MLYHLMTDGTVASVIPVSRPGETTRRAAQWRGGPTVLAFLFAMPDSDTIRLLDARGEYFHLRTGDTWDLFFPGYNETRPDKNARRGDARRVGQGYARRWGFNAQDFDNLRRHVEERSGGRWHYSGGTDLVLINCWVPDQGEPTIDWASTICGQLTDRGEGTQTLTLANIIERITHDLEQALKDPAYGVGAVTDEPSAPTGTRATRDVAVEALGNIAAAIMMRATGMS